MSEFGENHRSCILVVDDDSTTRTVLAAGLHKAGYELLQAGSADAALRLLAQRSPDLAVLDVEMPGMSGIELARRLREVSAIPLMFLTAHGGDELVAQAIELGAVGYLVKPVDIRQFMPAVRTALARAGEIRQLQRAEAELSASLNQIQDQLIQTDKLAAIGQLAAGVAHEINNPIGYVHSNLGTLENYIGELFRALDALLADTADAARRAEVERIAQEFDLPFLREDIPALLGESREGIKRVRKIVQDLKDFSHVDASKEWQWADLHQGLDSTLNIVRNEIKYKAEIVKEYGEMPQIECLPGQLNQVFMNLLVNAAHAIGDSGTEKKGRIVLRTGSGSGEVWVEIEDNGCGIPPENLPRIFNPFFTTKPVGKGTGLGLSLSYGIVQKHGGAIRVDSTVGEGTIFRVVLPERQSAA